MSQIITLHIPVKQHNRSEGTACCFTGICIEHPTGVYIVLPEEDTTKYFIVSLVIQQINAELTAMAVRIRIDGGSRSINRLWEYP